MKKSLLFLICTFFPFISFAEKYELSICAIFQNESRFLKEWIDFHLEQGVEHFYLYDNNSIDNPYDVLEPYIEKGYVTFCYWDLVTIPNDFWDWIGRIQCGAYRHFINQYGKETKWVTFLDTDEFLFCPDGTKLNSRIKEYKDFGGVCVFWIHYGTNNIFHSDSIHDDIVYRSKIDFPFNKHVKSICQVSKIKDIQQPHYPLYKPPYFHIDENKNKINEPTTHPLTIGKFRINHYWARDLDFFLNEKIPRRALWKFGSDKCIEMEKQMNGVFDPIISNKNQIRIKKIFDLKQQKNLVTLEELLFTYPQEGKFILMYNQELDRYNCYMFSYLETNQDEEYIYENYIVSKFKTAKKYFPSYNLSKENYGF